MRTNFVRLAILLFVCSLAISVHAQDDAPTTSLQLPTLQVPVLADRPSTTGDRILTNQVNGPGQSISAVSVPISDDYTLGAGDVISIVVEGKANLNYHAGVASSQGDAQGEPSDKTTVTPSGQITLPIIGSLQAVGKTVGQLQQDIQNALSEYYKNFKVRVALVRPRMMKVFVNGTVTNPGAQLMQGTSTVIEALLAAGFEKDSSTRKVELRRNGSTTVVDVYDVVVRGQIEKNMMLEPGDTIYVPPVTQWVELRGEVGRPGRYELLPGTKLRDLVDLAMGLTPVAVGSKVIVERRDAQGTAQVLTADADKACADPGCNDNIGLVNGDRLRVPSLSEYMPIVRMVGEFVGKDVFQRTIGQGVEQVQNKSGVYVLAKGKTAGDIIRETGGVTPQADLKNARIRRMNGNDFEELPLDLEKLLVKNDSSADMVLQSGDTIVLPALLDKIHVFGAVTRPGSHPYAPNRRLLDYVADAGGQTASGRMSHVRVIRGDPGKPVILNCDLTKGVKGQLKDNPLLEPGDAVFVAERDFNSWRDLTGMLTTFGILRSLVK